MSPAKIEITNTELRKNLSTVLPEFLVKQRWFGSKSRAIQSVEVLDVIPVLLRDRAAGIFLVDVLYKQAKTETYSLPLVLVDEKGEGARDEASNIPRLSLSGSISLSDAVWDKQFTAALFESVASSATIKSGAGEFCARETPALRSAWNPTQGKLESRLMGVEQSNTSIIFGDRFVLKFFRRLEEGLNPDVEIGMFLTTKTGFKSIASVAGLIEYNRTGRKPVSLAILQNFIPNQGDAWKFTLQSLDGFMARAAKTGSDAGQGAEPKRGLLAASQTEPPQEIAETIGDYLGSAKLLGRRTAEMHVALASGTDDANFAPEIFTSADAERLRDAMRELAGRILGLLREQMNHLAEASKSKAENILAREKEILEIFDALPNRKFSTSRIRIHGDYHLGQVLYTGKDFVIIDFEGEPARTLEERRAKRLPLQDVAGMLRSFHYAAYTALDKAVKGEKSDAALQKNLESWARAWHQWVSAAYLKSYFEAAAGAVFLPGAIEEREELLKAFLLDKAIYELGYELNNRPDWVQLPLNGILQLLQSSR